MSEREESFFCIFYIFPKAPLFIPLMDFSIFTILPRLPNEIKKSVLQERKKKLTEPANSKRRSREEFERWKMLWAQKKKVYLVEYNSQGIKCFIFLKAFTLFPRSHLTLTFISSLSSPLSALVISSPAMLLKKEKKEIKVKIRAEDEKRDKTESVKKTFNTSTIFHFFLIFFYPPPFISRPSSRASFIPKTYCVVNTYLFCVERMERRRMRKEREMRRWLCEEFSQFTHE